MHGEAVSVSPCAPKPSPMILLPSMLGLILLLARLGSPLSLYSTLLSPLLLLAVPAFIFFRLSLLLPVLLLLARLGYPVSIHLYSIFLHNNT